MIVVGVMSGTSADGIDVALVRILGNGSNVRVRLIAHEHFPYSRSVRDAVLSNMNAGSASVGQLARLNFLLAELYAGAVAETLKRHRSSAGLVGCHGQTLYHQGDPAPFLGRPIAATWQIGDGSVIAARLGIPVVSDFRPADMAVGGTGAPLVPLLDIVYYAHRRKLRVLQNLGGIANLTIIPPGTRLGKAERVLAFDTGPGNMVIDACTQALYGKAYDAHGAIAAQGKADESMLERALEHPFFRRKPPKSAGREEFGREFVADFLRWSRRRAKKADIVATATALTAVTIGRGLRQGLATLQINMPSRSGTSEFVASGGGTQNKTLMRMISEQVKPCGFRVLTSENLGMPNQAKEAAAFALLAYQTWHRQPGNVPSATGAKRPVVLGKISYGRES